MNAELNALKQKWIATGSWRAEQEYLAARVRCGDVPCVDLDPEGSWQDWLAVVVRSSTGVVYRNQCAGVACNHPLVEGFLVPVGLWDYENGARVKLDPFIDVFHEGEHCRYDWTGRSLPAERLQTLRSLVEKVRYWPCEWAGDQRPYRFCLDESRIDELAEAWIPVETPDGPGVLLYANCD